MTLEARRRFYAEEVEAIANLKTASVVEALATVPRERFLPDGPWTIRGEADFQGPPRRTPDADPRHVYHNLAVAIDPARQLFNGAPSFVAMSIDSLALQPGQQVLHIGCGTGYYSAIMASCVGSSGRVLAIDVDEQLTERAKSNLDGYPWVDVRHGDGTDVEGRFDAILVNAGVTHPLDVWLDALADRGRISVPVTVMMAPPIGKGLMLLVTRTANALALDARVSGFVAIYSAIGLRDATVNDRLGQALRANPFPAVKRLRRDPHEPDASCWMHGTTCCISLSE
jgi:protein-L-isoaspartate(D-aspartate) O-methyltransferase